MPAAPSLPVAALRAAWEASLEQTATLYQPRAGTNRHGDPATVPAVKATGVACRVLVLRLMAPATGAGAQPVGVQVPHLGLPWNAPVADDDWAQVGAAWYRVVSVPPLPGPGVRQIVQVEPTRAPEGAP